jgi:hypothetical protein
MVAYFFGTTKVCPLQTGDFLIIGIGAHPCPFRRRSRMGSPAYYWQFPYPRKPILRGLLLAFENLSRIAFRGVPADPSSPGSQSYPAGTGTAVSRKTASRAAGLRRCEYRNDDSTPSAAGRVRCSARLRAIRERPAPGSASTVCAVAPLHSHRDPRFSRRYGDRG